jgi:hypothetical protein
MMIILILCRYYGHLWWLLDWKTGRNDNGKVAAFSPIKTGQILYQLYKQNVLTPKKIMVLCKHMQ